VWIKDEVLFYCSKVLYALCIDDSLLAAHMAMPCKGHLIAVLREFSYLKKHHNAIIRPNKPEIDFSKFKRRDWRRFYNNVEESIPPNAPKPLSKPVVIRFYVDARRVPHWFHHFHKQCCDQLVFEKQGSVEGATFRSEFVAKKTVAEVNKGIRYKLRMMGIPIDGPSYVYRDNMSALRNTSNPESTLEKKSNSIACHLVRESIAMDEMRTGYVNTNEN
jgi:hypothetical protein